MCIVHIDDESRNVREEIAWIVWVTKWCYKRIRDDYARRNFKIGQFMNFLVVFLSYANNKVNFNFPLITAASLLQKNCIKWITLVIWYYRVCAYIENVNFFHLKFNSWYFKGEKLSLNQLCAHTSIRCFFSIRMKEKEPEIFND